MSTRLKVLLAVKGLVAATLPDCDVLGLEDNDDGRDRVDEVGRATIYPGDPGQATIDLSPRRYNYEHEIPVELIAPVLDGVTGEEAIDAMASAIGAGIAADRLLGGLVEWLDISALVSDGYQLDGSAPLRGADLIITATYGVADPLN